MPHSRKCVALLAFVLACPQAGRAADVDRVRQLRQTLRDADSRHVFVIAHRADWHSAPENSLAGIANCVAMGIDAIEIDIRQTRDGHFVVIHDKTVDRTTTGRGKVADLTLAEIQALRLRDTAGRPTDEPVPTLAQAVGATQGRLLIYLDKTEDMIDAVDAEMSRLDAADQAIYYGSRTAAELRARYGGLMGRIVYLPKITAAVTDPAAMVVDLAPLRPAAYVMEFDRPDSAIFAAASRMKAAGARVFASTMWPTSAGGRTDTAALTDPDANWGWLIDRGVTVFCTDRPAELVRYLRKRGLREPAVDSTPVAAAGRSAAR